MGDFSWHVSDPGYRPISLVSAQNPGPVWMLAPDGTKWREDDYQGDGIFGGKNAHEALEEWNPGVRSISGRHEVDGVAMGMRPYGSAFFEHAVAYPLKFSFDPEANYVDLPAALPATQVSSVIGIYDFKITLTNGDILESEDEMESFWAAVYCGISGAQPGSEDRETLANYCHDLMFENLSGVEGYVRAMGHTIEYIGWIRSAHGVFREVMGMDKTDILGEPLLSYSSTPLADLKVFTDAYERGADDGGRDYLIFANEQIDRYKSGLPMVTTHDVRNVWSAKHEAVLAANENKAMDETLAYHLGWEGGAAVSSRVAYLGLAFPVTERNPFVRELTRRNG